MKLETYNTYSSKSPHVLKTFSSVSVGWFYFACSSLPVKTAQLQSDQTVMCCNADGFFIALHGEGQRGNIASILARVSLVSAASSQNT